MMNVFIPIARKKHKRDIVYEVRKLDNTITPEESKKGICVTAIVTLILLSVLLYLFVTDKHVTR